MKNFIKKIGFTFYSSDFYKTIKDEKAEKGLGFLALVSVFLGVCIGIIGIIIFLIFSPTLKREALKFVDTNYPKDLVVTIKDGKMTTNDNKPFFVKMSQDTKEKNQKENILAILPDEKASVDVLSKYSSLIVVASDGFIGENDQRGEVRIYPYKDMSGVFTKDFALKGINTLFKIAPVFLAIGAIPFIILFLLIMIGIHLIWLFFVALLIWAFLRLKKLDVSYKQSYRIGMYAIVPLIIIEILLMPFHLSGKLFSTAIILIFVLINTHNWQKESTQQSSVVEEIQNQQ